MVTEIEEGLWLRRGLSGKRRSLAIVGSMHGDEGDGATVVRELTDPDHPLWEASRDEVWLVIGNPRALQAGTRGSEEGADLSRYFGPEAGDGDDDGPEYERERAALLRKWLKPVDSLLDLRQTKVPTPPLAVVRDTPHHLKAVGQIGLNLAIVGRSEAAQETTLASLIDRSGGIGITAEVGQVGTARALDTARSTAVRFLTGSAEPAVVHVIEITEALHVPATGLQFARPLANGTEVHKGEVIATCDAGQIRLTKDAVVFLPREDAALGEPFVLLARERGRFDP